MPIITSPMIGLVTESQENNAEEQKGCKIDKPSFKVCATRKISQNCSLSRGPLQIGPNTNQRFGLILCLISQQEVFGGVFPLLKLQQIHIFYLPPVRGKKHCCCVKKDLPKKSFRSITFVSDSVDCI